MIDDKTTMTVDELTIVKVLPDVSGELKRVDFLGHPLKKNERALEVIEAIKAWDIAHYIEHGRFSLPHELRELMEAAT